MIDRPKQPPKHDDEDDDEFGNFQIERPTTPGSETAPDERPTVSPPFDVEEYAKESDSKMMAGRTPPPQGRETTTKVPPLPDFEAEDDPWKGVAPQRPRPRQITLTDESETEEARLRSVLMRSEPPPEQRQRKVAEAARRDAAAGRRPASKSDEPAPPTRAYPAEYEKDPFAHLGSDAPRSQGDRELADMRDRFSLGDYTGALEMAEAVIARDPVNAEANRCAEECRAKLIHMYTARVGPLDRVPVVLVAREQLRWLSIDHRAGFLLSHVDGVSSLEMILDVSGMPVLDALKILAELSQQRVISFR